MKHSSEIFFPSFSLRRLITAWSWLSVQVVTLDTRHCSGASRNNPLCLTKLWPKPVRNKDKTWVESRRAFPVEMEVPFLQHLRSLSSLLDADWLHSKLLPVEACQDGWFGIWNWSVARPVAEILSNMHDAFLWNYTGLSIDFPFLNTQQNKSNAEFCNLY